MMSTPGPSQLLMLPNSLGCGFKKALSTVAGDFSANVLQMTTAAVGLVSQVSGALLIFVAMLPGLKSIDQK